MASDIKTTSEDADMAECDGEKVVTMMDVLQEQEDFEEDANAVLGASDDKNCTYSKGYIKRQAIYACMTCCPDAKSDPNKRAGVCLACSLMCHENHELVELYTKRNFRCDCGNPKFNSHPCTFTPDKTDLNEDNYYNQNFSGLYCTCQRPYPDPEESTVEDEMVQCIVCEDWLHTSHLESTVPPNEQYSEMICKVCMEKNEFLHDYSELAVNIESVDVDVVNFNGVDANNTKLSNGDANTEATDSTLNENVTKPDVEMSEEKAEASVPATDTSTLENKENNENDSVSKDKSEIEDKKEGEAMEINQSEQVQSSDVTSEETTSSITQEPSDNEQKVTESETKIDTTSEIDDISKDTFDEPAMVSDEPEKSSNKTNDENVSDKSEDIDKSKEQQSAEEINNKQDEESPTNDPEKPKPQTEEEIKVNEKNAEQMEEDKLLADPEDDISKIVSVEKDDKKSPDNDVTSHDTAKNKEEPKSEPSSDISEKSNEKLDSVEISNKRIEQNENDSNIEINSKSNATTNSDGSNENKIQSENVTTEDKNSMEPIIQNESTKEDKNIPEEDKNVTEPTIQNETTTEDESKSSEKRKLTEEDSDNIHIKKPKLDDKPCVRPKGIKKIYKGATFWPSNFRQKLCTCQECISMYNDLSVLFLTDPEDTVSAYENLGKQKINGKPATQYEKGLQALSSLDRIQQINALTEYNKMRDKLLDFLKSFKDRKEIVKEEDIKAFFAGMRPKREPDGVYFCR